MTFPKIKACLLFQFKTRSATFWLLCSQQLSSGSFAAHLHFGVFKIKSNWIKKKKKSDYEDDDGGDDGCSWRASLKKHIHRRNFFWVDARPLSLRLQPLHIVHIDISLSVFRVTLYIGSI